MKSSRILQIVFLPLLLLLGHFFLVATPAAGRPPTFISCPSEAIRGSHCDVFQVQVQAIDLDPPGMGGAITYILIDGPGRVDSRTGEWSYSPSGQDAGRTFQVEIAAWDGEIMTNGAQNCRFQVIVDPNHAPRISLDIDECGSSFSLYAPGRKFVPLYAYDLDRCDQVTTFIESITPELVGYVSLGGSWGLTFVADSLDVDKTFLVNIAATDGIDTTYCEITFVTHSIEPYRIRIEKTHDTYQGMHECVDVTLESAFGPLDGFNFLIAYDATPLNFIKATPGDLYDQCDWEYFTYRYGQFGNCGSECPSGMLRVVGIAETNNGPYHPSCFLPDSLPAILFTMDFLVTDDRTWECQFVPISFFWCDCGDNILSSRYGDSLFVSRFVYDSGGVDITQNDSFPTYFGAPSECLSDPHSRIRLIDFYNGGVGIVCAEPIDATGDINLNGTPYEIADMVLFTNYFIYGMGVFHINTQDQIAATDMNGDGITLDIADMVYGIRIVVGDAIPYDRLTPSPNMAKFVQDTAANTVEVETPDTLGAAYMVVEGNVSSIYLHQQDMDLKYAFNSDQNVTRILIYSFEGHSFVAGPLVSYRGEGVLIEASTATYYGGKVETMIEVRGPVPNNFALYQNYPNPFNDGTVIAFDLPVASEVDFKIVNILGRVVYNFHRYYPGGWHQINWNGTDNSGSPIASGVYYYWLKTSEYSDSKKMILLK